MSRRAKTYYYDTVFSMAPTMRRGLLRLALIFMIVWNLVVAWFLLKSQSEDRSRTISSYLAIENDCAKSRPFRDCWAEYEKSIGGYSQWDDFKKEFTPVNVAVIELLPPIIIGIIWSILWGIRATVLWVLRGFGIQIKKPREPGDEVVPLTGRLRRAGQWFLMPKNIIAVSVGIVALAVSYYVLVSLPASNRERLQFEKDAAAAAKAERDTKEQAAVQAAQDRDLSLQACVGDAETTYWSYVKLNGKEIPGKPGTYSAAVFVWNTADKRKADALAECHRQYDPKK